MIESKRSESIMNLAAALAVAQGQIRTAAKSETANTGKFSYSYSPLDEIWDVARKPLSENGLSVVQVPTNDESGFYLETILIHSSGEWISGQMSLPVEAGRMSQLQAMGSAITYARRYMLSSMVGIATGDDDDGQAAAQVERKPECMTLAKLLVNLNNVKSGVTGFYQKSDDILACRSKSSILPEPDDLAGWRVFYKDARDYALEQKRRMAEEHEAEKAASVYKSEIETATEIMRYNGDDDPVEEAEVKQTPQMDASTRFWQYANANGFERKDAGKFIQDANGDFDEALKALALKAKASQ